MSLLLTLCFCFSLLFGGYGLSCLLGGLSTRQLCFWQDVVSAKNYFVGLVLLLLVLNLGQAFAVPVIFCLLLLLPLPIYGLFKIRTKLDWRLSRSQLLLLLPLLLGIFYLWSSAKSLPLITWDSWNGWELKARQWLAHGWSVPLVDYIQWPQQQTAIFNLTAAYPDGLSLLYYLAHLSGFEFRSIMTVIYLFSYFILLWSLCLRLLRSSANHLLVLFALLLFFCLPLLNSHLIFQGYADIWLAMLLLITVLTLADLNQKHRSSDMPTFFILLIGLPLFKQEGWIWLALLLFAQLLNRVIIRRHRFYLLGIFVSALLLWFAIDHWSYGFAARTVVISQHYLKIGSLTLSFIPQDISSEWFYDLFLQNNWGALYFSLPFVLLSWFVFKYSRSQQVSQTFFTLALISCLLLFSLTDAATWAKDFTAINRVMLQLTPCYVYLLLQSMLSLSKHHPVNKNSP